MHAKGLTRRGLGRAIAAAAAVTATPLRFARGDTPIRIGLVLPYSGVYAKFGEGITDGIDFVLKSANRQLGGRPVEIIRGDDQLDAKVGGEVGRRLLTRDKVDILVGPVGSNVAPVLYKLCVDAKVPLIIPTAANNELTRALCSPLVFRVSHSHWQLAAPMAKWLLAQGKKRMSCMAMNYAAGKEEVEAFSDTFRAGGGEIVDQKFPGLNELDYQAYFADVPSKKPEGMFTFFAGANAVEFVKQYAQSGLSKQVPLYGAQYLTDSTLLPAEGAAANGVVTSAYWTPTLKNPANERFVRDFKAAMGKDADLNSMHGHDTATVLSMALATTKGDVADRTTLLNAIKAVSFDSPRGPFRFSHANNPVMDVYAVRADDGRLDVVETMQGSVEDPAQGCKMA